jgi:ABC-2 type transport system permease protein
VSYIVDAVRALMVSGDLADVPLDLLVLAVFMLVMFALASVGFRRIIE